MHEPRAQAAWEERENDGKGKRHAQLSAASTTWRPRPARSGVCPGARVAQDDLRRFLKLREGNIQDSFFVFFLDLFRANNTCSLPCNFTEWRRLETPKCGTH